MPASEGCVPILDLAVFAIFAKALSYHYVLVSSTGFALATLSELSPLHKVCFSKRATILKTVGDRLALCGELDRIVAEPGRTGFFRGNFPGGNAVVKNSRDRCRFPVELFQQEHLCFWQRLIIPLLETAPAGRAASCQAEPSLWRAPTPSLSAHRNISSGSGRAP